jgi:hypothetical protein
MTSLFIALPSIKYKVIGYVSNNDEYSHKHITTEIDINYCMQLGNISACMDALE